MNYDVLLKKITRLCAELVSAGGASELIPLKMNYICNEYGLKESEFIVYPNGVFSTAVSPDGTNLTAIRSIDGIGSNFGKLQHLDEFCNSIPETLPSAEEIDCEIDKINQEKYLSVAEEYIASVFLGSGFALLFGSDFYDTIVAVICSIVIAFLSSFLKKKNCNTFFLNAVASLVVESFILFTVHLGLCHNPESVSLGVIMLLISGLNFSEGLWALINKETSIGLYKLNNSVLGAVGIVIGIATPLFLTNNVVVQGLSNSDPLLIQAIKCTIACSGFAALCCVRKKDILIVALGSALAYVVDVLFAQAIPSNFVCKVIATFAVTLYALIVSKKLNINPGILRMVGILPLVPGSNLFYMLFGLISRNGDLVSLQFTKLVTTCLGISFGFTLGRFFIGREIPNTKENASK